MPLFTLTSTDPDDNETVVEGVFDTPGLAKAYADADEKSCHDEDYDGDDPYEPLSWREYKDAADNDAWESGYNDSYMGLVWSVTQTRHNPEAGK